jgi:hypothetical protein
MNFKEQLMKYKESKTRVLINGLGDGTTKGTILEVYDDFIDYELLNIQTEKKTKKEKQTREVKHIQIAQIFDVGEGEKEKEISQNGFEKGLMEVTEKKE